MLTVYLPLVGKDELLISLSDLTHEYPHHLLLQVFLDQKQPKEPSRWKGD
jgi:hypothetical protein